jgi:carboxyl-terminal processing protease
MLKKLKISLIAIVAIIVVSLAFGAGCIVGGNISQGQSPSLDLIDQAWSAIYKNYVDPTKLDSTTLSHGAVKGIMSALNDPYSAFLDPEMYKLFQSDLQGTFQGIGAQVTMNNDNQPAIVAPLEGSPAEKAGIKTGDIILAINGKSTKGISLTEAVLNIRGPAGTPVKLTIQHEGQSTPVEIDVVRAQISSSTVSWKMEEDIAYIKINEFGDKTNSELNNALQSISLQKTAGIILDLRSNPGGIVNTVVDVASHFIRSGVIITMMTNQGEKSSISVHPNGIFTDLPMVVLVDQYSASGSEVLTGALRDHNRATIAGVKTFGKGSYDINIPLEDGSDIYLTVGRWLTPNGQLIEGKGIEPNYTLTVTGDDEIQWAVDFLHKQKETKDVQAAGYQSELITQPDTIGIAVQGY